jgi:hypothetical protein
MPIVFDRDVFFDKVREDPESGSLSQIQVDGLNAILKVWEDNETGQDLRWLAYALATTKHETGSAYWPIEEYGKGSGMEYGSKDPETGQTYYGRGFVQTTWRDNYAKADDELGLGTTKDDPTSCEWHADNSRANERGPSGGAVRRSRHGAGRADREAVRRSVRRAPNRPHGGAAALRPRAWQGDRPV